MARKFLLAASAATVVATGIVLSGTPAHADELTTFTAAAEPAVVQPGETVTVTLTVTNEHDRKITYDPIVAPDEFGDCAQDVGTLDPGTSATVTCSAVVTAPLTATFSIANAESEHNVTSAEATVNVTLEDEPDEPEEPTTAPPVQEAVDQPTLPTTGSSTTPVLVTGVGLLLIGLLLASRLAWRRT